MGTVHTLALDLAYLKELIGAGLDGIAAARQEHDGRVFVSVKPMVLTSTVIGAAVGTLSSRMTGSRRSASKLAVGGLAGSILGCGAAVVWTSRHFTWAAASRARGLVNQVRDAHWLDKHPIDYA